MGTRSWTRFYARRNRPTRLRAVDLIGIVYRQFDGDPSCVGVQVAEFASICQLQGLGAHEAMRSYVTNLEERDVRHHVEEQPLEDTRCWEIAYVYDIICGGETPIYMRVVTQGGWVTQPEWVVAQGTPERVLAWILGLSRYQEYCFDSCTNTVPAITARGRHTMIATPARPLQLGISVALKHTERRFRV